MTDGDLRELYQEVILDHGRHPRHFGRLTSANREAEGRNPLCGDELHLYLKVDEDDRIADVRFEGRGCAISVASASMMTELVKGKPVTAARALMEAFVRLARGEAPNGAAIADDDLERLKIMSGVSQFPMRVKCATLAWHTLASACESGATVTTE
jgi:nitrogen fixation NifU-like protein